MSQIIITDDLGFRLKVIVSIGDFQKLGEHRTYVDGDSDRVTEEMNHRLNIKSGLESRTLGLVAAHEVYHLFYSVRHLITTDEETQAEVFGDLVGHIIEEN